MANAKLHICKIICHKCKNEYNAAYKTVEIDGKRMVIGFNEQDKIIAKENDIIIESRAYGRDNPDIYIVNICPHCGEPFGENHIHELVGKKFKEITIE